MATCFIGLGSNLGDSQQTLADALVELDKLPSTGVTAVSRFYNSVPLSDAEQPDYVNAVCQLETQLKPEQLLANLQQIEKKFGRVRGEQRWQSRTLDLDLLAYADVVMHTNELTLPHPEIAVRDFVLVPWCDIAPEFRVPTLGSVRELRACCTMRGINPMQSA
jgi:2-amino-4-hydroxy-6-hydroxymethyldihydropteridine diphosphokinase